MTTSRIKIFILLMAIMISASVFMAGCSQQSTQDTGGGTDGADSTAALEKIYTFYDKVQLGQTKAEVDTALGVTAKEPMADIFQYTDKNGNGVMIGLSSAFSQDGTSKFVFDKRVEGLEAYLIKLPDDKRITAEQAQSITEGMTYEEVKAKLGGEGYELNSTQGFEGKPEITRVWMKKGISMLTVKFSGPDGTDTAKIIVDL
ncbi:hypothetical protein [Acetobacterium sp.]|uniref:hypothetical protein n=1 Tax=Acetobacterium sp. TaxID=1872094 RepID=UPI0035938492